MSTWKERKEDEKGNGLIEKNKIIDRKEEGEKNMIKN